MPPLTTGLNTTEQATAILDALRAQLPALGAARITRGHLWQIPDRPCAVLLGPTIDMGTLSIGREEAQYHWALLIARDVADSDRRADLLDTWADLAMATLMDLSRTTDTFSIQGGEGPDRVEDDSLVQLLERVPERIDAVLIRWSTRREICPPPC